MIVQQKTMPNGAAADYHKAIRFEIHADATHAVVNSYHNEEMSMISWQDTYVIPILFKIETLADVETILTLVGAPFDGGSIVPETVADLDSQKARRWAEVKVRRDLAIDGGVETPSGIFDSNETSRTNLLGAIQAASIAKAAGQPFTITWTMRDNTDVDLDADTLIAAGLTIMSFVDACHARARALRSEIIAAADETELAAIDITADWP